MGTIQLDDKYFIEQCKNGFILKEKYIGTRKGVSCECSKSCGFFPDEESAVRRFLRLIQVSKTDVTYISFIQYVEAIKRSNEDAVSNVLKNASKRNKRSKEEIQCDRKEAERLFECIPEGHFEPLKRPADKFIDRALRAMVNRADKSGDCIINVGNGYYRPNPDDPVDDYEFNIYIKSEHSRQHDTGIKCLSMKEAYTNKMGSQIAKKIV